MIKTRVISFINQKGGVAKTTSTINTAAGLSLLKKKVLVIDFDQQANLTEVFFSSDYLDNKPTIYHLIENYIKDEETLSITDIILNYKNDNISFDIIPSSEALKNAEYTLINQSGRELFLKNILSKIKGYDYILIDCPPSLGILTINVLSCSEDNELVIPTNLALFSKAGIRGLFETINTLNKKGISKQKDYHLLITEYVENEIISRETEREIEDAFGNKIFKTKIRKNNAVEKAHNNSIDVISFDPKSNGAVDYLNFAKELIKMEAKNG